MIKTFNFIFSFFDLEIESYYVALAGLQLTKSTRQATEILKSLDSQRN